MDPYEHELSIAMMEAEARAARTLARNYARLAYLRSEAENLPPLSPGQLRLVV